MSLADVDAEVEGGTVGDVEEGGKDHGTQACNYERAGLGRVAPQKQGSFDKRRLWALFECNEGKEGPTGIQSYNTGVEVSGGFEPPRPRA